MCARCVCCLLLLTLVSRLHIQVPLLITRLSRQEFILLSDTLGLSLLIDSISHPKPASSTEGTVLGPYHVHDAPSIAPGSSISGDPDGEPLLCLCTVKTTSGQPIPNVKIDIWETDSKGSYDVQYEGYSGEDKDGRAVLRSDEEGNFWFKAIVPVPYRIPEDGPVGRMLGVLGTQPPSTNSTHLCHETSYVILLCMSYTFSETS